MTTTATTNLITGALTTFGGSVLVILGAVLTIGVAYLVFRFGWRAVKNSTGSGTFNRGMWDRADHHYSNMQLDHDGIRHDQLIWVDRD